MVSRAMASLDLWHAEVERVLEEEKPTIPLDEVARECLVAARNSVTFTRRPGQLSSFRGPLR